MSWKHVKHTTHRHTCINADCRDGKGVRTTWTCRATTNRGRCSYAGECRKCRAASNAAYKASLPPTCVDCNHYPWSHNDSRSAPACIYYGCGCARYVCPTHGPVDVVLDGTNHHCVECLTRDAA